MKIPDADSNASGTFQIRAAYSTLFDANGVSVVTVLPDPACMVINTLSTSIAGGTTSWTYATNYTAQNPYSSIASLTAVYGSSRMVSGAVVVRNIGSSAGTGVVMACPVFIDASKDPATGGFNATLPLNLAQLTESPSMVRFPVQTLIMDELICVFKHVSPNAYDYRSLTQSWSQTAHLGGVENIVGVSAFTLVATGGVANAPALDIEFCVNYEALPVGNSNISSLNIATPPAPYRPLLMAAAETLIKDTPDARLVDDAGVEEDSFMRSMESAWKVATKVASSVTDVAGVIAKVGALVL